MTVLLLFSGTAYGQTEEEEPSAALELGGAAEQNLKGGSSNYGPTIALEVTPIENWLELEGGVTSLLSHGNTEWDTDLLFKKPWTLSDKVEFMFGVGPEWVHTTGHGSTSYSVSGEVVLDFMFWPSSKHRFGWYLEPKLWLRFWERARAITGYQRGSADSDPQQQAVNASLDGAAGAQAWR